MDWGVDSPLLPVDNINVLELQCVLVAARRWGQSWSGLHIQVASDNMSTVAAVNKSTSRSEQLMPIIRDLFWLAVEYNFRLSAVHILGKDNVLIDRLSRLHYKSAAADARFLLTLNNFDIVLCKDHMTYDSFVSLQTRWCREWLD
jgi:hypothetical protein